MITIRIGNSESIVLGADEKHIRAFRNATSYELPGVAYSKNSFTSKRYLMDAKGRFPTGLLYKIIDVLDKDFHKTKYVITDTRVKPEPYIGLFTLKTSFIPYEEQIRAAEVALATTRGIIVSPTGTGKSLIINLIIEKLQVPTLVVVPTLELKRQLTDTLSKAFGANRVGEGKPICVQNVASIPDTPLKGYDCVIIDEFHHSGAESYRRLNKKAWNGVYYKFGMTATPFRSQDSETILLESVLYEVIYRFDYADAVRLKRIVAMEAYYYELPRIKVSGTTWAKVYREGVVNNTSRNDLIASLICSLSASKVPTLCLVKEVEHGKTLSDMSHTHFAHGVNEDTPLLIDAFNANKISSLIGTNGVLGEGIDTKPCEFVIIAGLGKSRNQFMQSVGRAFRKNSCKETCKIIIFKDKSHPWFIRHFNEQVKILKEEYGIIPAMLEINT